MNASPLHCASSTGTRLKSERSAARSWPAASRCTSRCRALGPCRCGEVKSSCATRDESTRSRAAAFSVSRRCHSGRKSSMCGGSSARSPAASACNDVHPSGVLGYPASAAQTSTSCPPSTLMLRPLLSSTISALEPSARFRKLPTARPPSCHSSTAAPEQSRVSVDGVAAWRRMAPRAGRRGVRGQRMLGGDQAAATSSLVAMRNIGSATAIVPRHATEAMSQVARR